jgi:type VI secretion system secreted protein Hcp
MAADCFIKMSNKIDGESTDAKHKNEIDVMSWSLGCSQDMASYGAGTGAGKVNFNDFNFATAYSKASPELMLKCSTGEPIDEVIFVARKAGKEQQEYLKITMNEVLVKSISTSGAGGPELPTESIALGFAKIKVEYKPQKEDGTLGGAVTAGWNLKENKKV